MIFIRSHCYLAVVLLALLAAPATAQPGCSAVGRETSGYCFTSEVIDALSFAHTAALTKPDTAGLGHNLVGLGAAMLYVSARQRTGIEHALRVLTAYGLSRDSLITEAANEISRALNALRLTSVASDSALRDVLDGKTGSPSSQAQKLADLRNRRHASASLLSLSVIAVTYTLLEQNPPDTLHQRLNIRASERQQLLNKMQDLFGENLKAASSTGQYSTDYAAAVQLLDSFLRQDWPTR